MMIAGDNVPALTVGPARKRMSVPLTRLKHAPTFSYQEIDLERDVRIPRVSTGGTNVLLMSMAFSFITPSAPRYLSISVITNVYYVCVS